MANAVFISYSCSPLGIGKITGTTKSGIAWTGSTSMSAGTYLTGGTVLQWTATPVSGYNVSFQAWYYTTSMPDDPVSYSGSFTSMILGTNWKTLEIKAVYSSVGPSSYNVTFSSTAAEGSISPSGTISYNSGTTVQVTAQANAGYRFNVWTGNYLSGGTGLADNFKTATANFTVNKTGTVTANYWPAYRCDVVSSDINNGTVTKTYANTQGPWGNIPLYDKNASITLTATALTNYEFVNWTDTNSGSVLSTSNPYTFSLTADKYITGNFRGATKTISTSVSPASSGTTTVGGSTRYGEVCTISATPSSHYHFINWTEGGTPIIADNPWSFTVTGNRTLVANMAIDTHLVAVSVNNSTMGTASGDGLYDYGATAIVSAIAKTGYHFVQWINTNTGTAVSTNASYSFIVNSDISLRADFAINSYTITVSSNNTNRGTVSGGGSYDYNSTCTLVGAPKTGYQFQNWTEGSTAISTTTPYSFTVTAARTIVGNFIPLTYTISASASPAAGGSVSGAGTKDYNSSVTVTASANNNYQFVNWTEGGTQVSTSASYTFTCTGTRTLVANFELKSYNVTVSAGTGGTVSGGGSYAYNTTATVYAAPFTGYQFTNWTEGTTVVSTSATYSFTVTKARTLVANFVVSSTNTSGGLLVWLPLNGNIINRGLSNLKFSIASTNTTVNANGKIGSCYYNNSFSSGGLYSDAKISLPTSHSMFCWFKFESLNSSSSLGGGLVTVHNISTINGTGITIKYVSSTTGYLSLNTANGTNRTFNQYCGTTLLQANTWYHGGFTYDGSNIRIYLNGVLEKTQAYTGMVMGTEYVGIFMWSMNPQTGYAGYKFKGWLNDVRIYGHALSVKEVKEIAKGLILHYKFDSPYLEGTTNLITTKDCLSNTCYNGATNKYSYGTNTDMYKTTGEFQGRFCTKVYMGTNGLAAYPYIYFDQFSAKGTEIQTLSFDYYPTTQTSIVPYSYNGTYNFSCVVNGVSKSATNVSAITLPVNVGVWNHVSITAQKYDTTNTTRGIGYIRIGAASHTSNTDNYWLFANAQVENKDHETGYAGVGGTRIGDIIYDNSGNGYSGTVTGNIQLNTSSARYDKCIFINSGNTDYITSPLLGNSSDSITLNIWFKSTCTTPGSNYHEVFNSSTNVQNFEFAINYTGYFRQGMVINGTRYVINGGSGLLNGNWHMLTATYDGSSIKRYIDGEIVSSMTQSVSGALTGTNSGFLFGHYGPNTSYYAKEAYLSDARVYATALSADDVKELYNTSMTIDDDGNVYARELIDQ